MALYGKITNWGVQQARGISALPGGMEDGWRKSEMLNEMMIRCFLSLCDTRSFTHTASVLFLSQQAVSHNIAKMEEELGVRLFRRGSRGATPTEFALRYQEVFLRLASELTELHEDVQRAENPFRELQIGYQIWLDFGRAPYRALSVLHREEPDVRYRVERYTPAELRQELLSGGIELAIMYERFQPSQSGFASRRIVDSRNVMLAAADYPGLTRETVWQDLRRAPLVFDSAEESSTAKAQRDARAFSARVGLDPCTVVVKRNRESAYTAVEQGAGVIVTTEISRAVGSASFAKLPMDSSESIVAVWNEHADGRLVKRYIAALTRELAEISFDVADAGRE